MMNKQEEKIEEVQHVQANDIQVMKPSRLIKNVVLISIAFMMTYTANDGAASLQSSINAEDGLGTVSMAFSSAAFTVSGFILAVACVNWLGTKWTMVTMLTSFMPYIVAQIEPSFATFIPTAVFAGLGAAPAWCALCTYLADVSKAYNKISNKVSVDSMLSRFFGLFYMIFNLNLVWGNLISSFVLSTQDNEAAVTSLNSSMIPEICGVNFVPLHNSKDAFKPQPPQKIKILVGIYLSIMAIAVLIIAFGVDSAKRFSDRKENQQRGMALFLATMKVFFDIKQLLMVFICIFIGASQSFVVVDFTAAYVSCTIGTGAVGFVMVACGLANAVGCLVTGYLAKSVGRIPLIVCALVVTTSVLATLLIWRPQAHLGYVIYIIATVFGVCNSVWVVQINAFYGIMFPENDTNAFTCCRICEGVGYVIMVSLSHYTDIRNKCYFLLALMIAGVIGYLIVDLLLKKDNDDTRTELKVIKGYDNAALQAIEHIDEFVLVTR